jgi:hypothetical protein
MRPERTPTPVEFRRIPRIIVRGFAHEPIAFSQVKTTHDAVRRLAHLAGKASPCQRRDGAHVFGGTVEGAKGIGFGATAGSSADHHPTQPIWSLELEPARHV